MSNFFAGLDGVRTKFGRLGGIDALLDVLSQHKDSEALTSRCLKAAWTTLRGLPV